MGTELTLPHPIRLLFKLRMRPHQWLSCVSNHVLGWVKPFFGFFPFHHSSQPFCPFCFAFGVANFMSRPRFGVTGVHIYFGALFFLDSMNASFHVVRSIGITSSNMGLFYSKTPGLSCSNIIKDSFLVWSTSIFKSIFCKYRSDLFLTLLFERLLFHGALSNLHSLI